MRDVDFKRIHCGRPVTITKLYPGPKSGREHLGFKCEHCGYEERELRSISGALLNWQCISVGTRHEKRQQSAVA